MMCRLRFAHETLVCLLLLSPPLAAQDPWSKVPPSPTACYDREQTFVGTISDISHELVVAADKQAEINAGIQEKFNNIDPMEKQSKMMAFMMKNPTEAGKMMQDIAMAGEKGQKDLERMRVKQQALQDQWKAAEAAWESAKGPMNAIREQYGKVVPDAGVAGNPVLARQLATKYDAEYEKLCASWLKSDSSPLLKYLADLKRFLLEEEIPMEDERTRHLKMQFDLYGIPSAAYKHTGVHKAVGDYLNGMHRVFVRRETVPLTGQMKD